LARSLSSLFHSLFHFFLAGLGLFLLALVGSHQVGAIGGHWRRSQGYGEIVAQKKEGAALPLPPALLE
jgi:hypothetical protein